MASDKSPQERATKKKTSSKSSAAKGAAVAASAAAVTAAAIGKKSKKKKVAAIVVFVSFLLGVVAGFFLLKILNPNDGFAMNGEDMTTVNMYEAYVDEGVKAEFFGKDYAKEVKITYYYREDISHEAEACNSVDTSVAGYYYVVYESDLFPYRGVQLIRTVEVLRTEDDGQAE